ncbi:MAG: DUF2155 domain-containing protein [Nitrospirae bacterium]|nr:DUF2155 domain-containing protein [Nitrospirota bacterium]
MKSINKIILFTLCINSIIGLNACTKKEQPKPRAHEQQAMMPSHADVQMPSSEQMKIVLSEEIKGKWKGVIISVMDKQTMNGRDYKVPIGANFTISGSNVEVQTGTFLPDLVIEDNVYSSESAELGNPAIQVEVKEGGKEIFKGWLFQKYPTVHPFKHERYSITLKEPVSGL